MYRNFIQHVPDLIQEVDFVGPIKSSKRVYKETIPEGLARLPVRLADPELMAAGKPTFLRIGEGNEPRNELLRVIKQYPSKDEVQTKVLGEMFPPNETNPYFSRPDNIAAIRAASEELGIPLERTGLRIATNPFRIEGDVANVNLLADITKQAAINLQRQGKPVLADALTRKASFFNQPRSYRELAVDGSEGIDSIIAAYEKAEPRVTANSQGNRPILMQADGLDPNIGIPSGSPENIPPMDVEGLRGAYAYKPADELKRSRFIDMGNGIYTRSGNPITREQKDLLDMGMADLEDRSFILRDPASANPSEQYRPTTRLGLQTLGLNADIGKEAILPAVDFSGMTLFPEERVVNRTIQPINRLTDDLSNRVLSGEVDLRNYEPFKSNRNTYGAREGKTPWREYYSDPFVYEDKGLDSEVNRLMKAVNEAPAQLENAYTQQALANTEALEYTNAINALAEATGVSKLNRIAKGSKESSKYVQPSAELIESTVEARKQAKPLFNPLLKQRRMAEIEAAKANDTIAQLKAAQELMGVEYMVKPKLWGEEVLNDYAQASRTKGAMKDSSYDERLPTTDSLNGWRQAIAAMGNQFADSRFDARYLARDRDYDIATLFGFSGNY